MKRICRIRFSVELPTTRVQNFEPIDRSLNFDEFIFFIEQNYESLQDFFPKSRLTPCAR